MRRKHMPIVKLSMIEGRTVDEKHTVIECIHSSLIESFKIPEDDKNFRVIEFKKEDYILPPDKSDKYVLIEITIFPGRTIEAKRLLYRKIVENLKDVGIDSNDIFIILYEEPLDNWGIRGGYPASEIDLGFNLKV
jgi:phenylpyruvate tautomerase PptA (4-oxalocrotonate tautomerase family)